MSLRDVNLFREKRRGPNSNLNSNAASTTNTNTNTTSTTPPSLNMVRSLSVPITPPPSETVMDYQMSPPSKKTRPIVLHGKVLNLIDADETEDIGSHKAILRMQMKRTLERQQDQTFERRSAFLKLTQKTEQFQKLVADLQGVLEQSGESPEASWRARIIIRSTQEAGKDLWDNLNKYEHSFLTAGKNTGSDGISNRTDKDTDTEHSQRELRTAQNACMKLHRDFNQSHKVLAMILSLHQKRLKAQAEASGSRAAAVRWSENGKDTTGATTQLHKKDEDLSDRAMRRMMREREAGLERKNKSAHKVNEIAAFNGQHLDNDILEDNVVDESATVQSGEEEINCRFCGAMNFSEMADDISYDFTEREGEEKQGSPFLPRKGEVFDWYMPFENIGEDMKSVHRDIIRMGKDIIQKGGKYTCEPKSSKS